MSTFQTIHNPSPAAINTYQKQIQLLQLHHGPSTATPMDAGGDGGAALGGRLDAEVVKEFPASGMLSYLNPLSYRATAQVPAR